MMSINHHLRCTKMGLLLLLSLLPLVVTRGFAISSPLHSIFKQQNNQRRRIIPLQRHHDSVLNLLRGGDNKNTNKLSRRNMSAEEASPVNNKRKRTIAISVAVTCLVAFLAFEYRVPLSAAFDKETLQNNVLTLLHSFHGDWRGVALYVCGMSVWELLGMSTIPVETAAGMVFGFRVGFWASAGGKLLGACMGFILGRTLLQNFIGHRLESNKTIQLIRAFFVMKIAMTNAQKARCDATLNSPLQPS